MDTYEKDQYFHIYDTLGLPIQWNYDSIRYKNDTLNTFLILKQFPNDFASYATKYTSSKSYKTGSTFRYQIYEYVDKKYQQFHL